MNSSQHIVAPRFAEFLAALAHPVRLQIIELLAERELPVKDLVVALGLSQAHVSQHLRVLRERDIVVHRPVGASHIYRLVHRDVVEWLRVGREYSTAAQHN